MNPLQPLSTRPLSPLSCHVCTRQRVVTTGVHCHQIEVLCMTEEEHRAISARSVTHCPVGKKAVGVSFALLALLVHFPFCWSGERKGLKRFAFLTCIACERCTCVLWLLSHFANKMYCFTLQPSTRRSADPHGCLKAGVLLAQASERAPMPEGCLSLSFSLLK